VDRPTSTPVAAASHPGLWQPRDLARVNEAVVRLAPLEEEFPWHTRDETEPYGDAAR
jgi:hypothetical protein